MGTVAIPQAVNKSSPPLGRKKKIGLISYSQFKNRNRIEVPSYDGRLKECRVLGRLYIALLVVGGLAVLSGVTTLFIMSPNPDFPFCVGSEIIVGILCIASGSFAFRIRRLTKKTEVLREKLKCSYVCYGVSTISCVCTSVIGLGLNTYVIILCTNPGIADAPWMYNKDSCYPNRDPNLAMAITNVILELLLFTLNVFASWRFSKHRHIFGVVFPCDKHPRPINIIHTVSRDVLAPVPYQDDYIGSKCDSPGPGHFGISPLGSPAHSRPRPPVGISLVIS